MIRRALWNIAGIDSETLSTCPVTDKLWATHLGFSLCLSFIVVRRDSFPCNRLRHRKMAGCACWRQQWLRSPSSCSIALSTSQIGSTKGFSDNLRAESDSYGRSELWRSVPKGVSHYGAARDFVRVAHGSLPCSWSSSNFYRHHHRETRGAIIWRPTNRFSKKSKSMRLELDGEIARSAGAVSARSNRFIDANERP